MGDQAEKLRKIMEKNTNNNSSNDSDKERAKIISVTSGKGGVGKTSFIINLAISLKQLGYKVVIIDADIGLANVDIISGAISKFTLADLFLSEKDIFDIMTDGPEGIKIISGGSGLSDFSLIDDANLDKLIEEIGKLENYSDFILIDTGAGISNNVLKFLAVSDEVILVVTPDPTSLTDGYVLVKALTLSNYKNSINIVVNMVENKREAEEVFIKLNTVSNKFLRVNLESLGYLNKSNVVSNAIRNQTPFILNNPNSSIAKKINIMALSFINKEEKNFRKKESNSFSQRIKEFFLGKGGMFI
ncbi:MinD/ParA family protein [Anaerosalibacter sp. Marseille-P3206]|uniref:MinD/ParA family protein n=1 Tax=Anaerosalibacter sp. Marseille-P3206 TaxID=1871005 RepID=UPI000987C4C6|nr:MinD/ParA family protein [Anaerosalibacter sp. Marseille-P3206]